MYSRWKEPKSIRCLVWCNTHSAQVNQHSMSQRDPMKTKLKSFFCLSNRPNTKKNIDCTAHFWKCNATRETLDNTAVPGKYIGWNPSPRKTWKILRLNRFIVGTNTAIFDKNSIFHQSKGVEAHNIPNYNKKNHTSHVSATIQARIQRTLLLAVIQEQQHRIS